MKIIFALLLLIVGLENAKAEVRVVAISLSSKSVSSRTSVDVLGGTPEDTWHGLPPAVALERLSKLENWGSSIFVFIEADDRVSWAEIKKFIDVALANPMINIKSVKHGSFVKTHEMVLQELRSSHDLESMDAKAVTKGDPLK